jgi:hypothetical protein
MKHFLYFFLLTGFFILLSTNAEAKTIPVPYTSQAPYFYWAEPWQNACEEASIVMLDNYYQGVTDKKITKTTAKKQILNLLEIKKQYYGKSLDENAQKVVNLINNFYNWEAKVVENPSLEQIKTEIDNDRPVIVPVYGKALKNIYFRNGGPYFHMLVLSGYDEETEEFITKEPGLNTLGLDFRYKYDTIMDALHDFTGKKIDTKNGAKVAIFTQKELVYSTLNDADKDGINKQGEFTYGSFPWSADTDKDGFSDKTEIESGHSPIIPAKKK